VIIIEIKNVLREMNKDETLKGVVQLIAEEECKNVYWEAKGCGECIICLAQEV
jgi:hypothetical protein